MACVECKPQSAYVSGDAPKAESKTVRNILVVGVLGAIAYGATRYFRETGAEEQAEYDDMPEEYANESNEKRARIYEKFQDTEGFIFEKADEQHYRNDQPITDAEYRHAKMIAKYYP